MPSLLAELVQVGGVLGTAEAEVGQALDRESRLAGWHRAAV